MIKIALIGCTGNIGKQAAQIVRENSERFCFSALVCERDKAGLVALCEEFCPEFSCCTVERGISDKQLEDIFLHCDVALIAASGFAGLRYTLAAVNTGRKVALANKESLVCGGELVFRAACLSGAEIIPVDSEHSALFQALSFRRDTPFNRLVLTASGGPFFHMGEEELKHVTAKEALNHPTWNMGAKITVDSATLLNKGYEVIEAKWLYGAAFENIQTVVHPESIVHSLVYFEDGAAMAQLAYPDMRLPIQLALTYPERLPCLPQLNLAQIGALHFYELPEERFPCFSLALQAGKTGGTAPTVLNGAGEEAVKAFLSGAITFPAIAETIRETLSYLPTQRADSYETLAETDIKARSIARRLLYG